MPEPESLSSALSTHFLPVMDVRPVAGPHIDVMRDVTFPLWARFHEGVPRAPGWQAAALSWAADYFPAQSMLVKSGKSPDEYFARTLEHSMWFHQLIDPSSWMQIDYQPMALADQRSHAFGTIHDRDGTLAATMLQVGVMLPFQT